MINDRVAHSHDKETINYRYLRRCWYPPVIERATSTTRVKKMKKVHFVIIHEPHIKKLLYFLKNNGRLFVRQGQMLILTQGRKGFITSLGSE